MPDHEPRGSASCRLPLSSVSSCSRILRCSSSMKAAICLYWSSLSKEGHSIAQAVSGSSYAGWVEPVLQRRHSAPPKSASTALPGRERSGRSWCEAWSRAWATHPEQRGGRFLHTPNPESLQRKFAAALRASLSGDSHFLETLANVAELDPPPTSITAAARILG